MATKKTISIFLLFALLISLAACGGDVSKVKIGEYHSEIYSDGEIMSAINEVMDYFKANFSGCTLTEITYIGDEENQKETDVAKRNNADDVIVLISSYYVDSSGGNGSLKPNSTYENWQWILVRSNGGTWRHVDHGY